MKKKFLYVLLLIVLAVGLAAGLPQPAQADSEMVPSQELVEMLKQFEGFVSKPVWDNHQYSVGYGTRCPDDKFDEYKANGIPPEEAEALLKDYLNLFANEINKFANTYGLKLSQQQFDALVSLTYNCGGGWTREKNGILHNAVKSGATGNQLIYAFGLWSRSGTEYKLMGRRMAEANLYLNGVYSTTPPANYRHVFFDANGGKVNYKLQAYDAGGAEPAPFLCVMSETVTIGTGAEAKTYHFQGWFTEPEGGRKVESLGGDLAPGVTLYAHWTNADQEPAPEEPPVVTCSHQIEVKGKQGASCDKAGYTGDQVCKLCGEMIAQGEMVPATGRHSAKLRNVKAATCAAAGYSGDKVCTVCGTVTEYGKEILPVAHKGVVKFAVAPGCADTGYTGDTVCSVCGTTMATGKTVEPTGKHTPILLHAKEATCAQPGYTGDQICKDCGFVVEEGTEISVISEHGAAVEDARVEPSCTQIGHTEGTHCELCGEILTGNEALEVLEHHWDGGEVLRQATEEEFGVEIFHCTDCAASKTVLLDKLQIEPLPEPQQEPDVQLLGAAQQQQPSEAAPLTEVLSLLKDPTIFYALTALAVLMLLLVVTITVLTVRRHKQHAFA